MGANGARSDVNSIRQVDCSRLITITCHELAILVFIICDKSKDYKY